MTISSEISKVTYLGDGATATFPIPFYFLANDEVKVIYTGEDATETVWSEGTHYALTGAGLPAGGTMTVSIAPSDFTPESGTSLTIKRDLDLVQETDYPEGGQFPASAHEQALDRIVMLLQQMNEEVARALKIPTSDVVGTDVETSSAAIRAQKVVCYDDDGNLTESTLTIGEIEAGTTDAAASAENAAVSAEGAALSANAAAASALAADYSADAAALSETNAQSYASQAASTLASAMWRDIVHVTSTASPYAVGASDNGRLLVCDTSSGAIVINLDTIASLGEPFNLSVKWESGANPVTVNRAGTDTIDGATSYILTSINSAVMLVADIDTAPDQWEKVEINAPIEVTFDTLPARMKTAVRLSLFNFAR
jgi:hypothetical protein